MKKQKIKKLINFICEESKQEIGRRGRNGYLLAKKFPELRGLTWTKFLKKLPIDLDFITANEMFEALSK